MATLEWVAQNMNWNGATRAAIGSENVVRLSEPNKPFQANRLRPLSASERRIDHLDPAV